MVMASYPIVPHVFLAGTGLALATVDWAPRWLLSGAPIISYCLLYGQETGNRVLPFMGTWSLLATINLFYAISATSWLLPWLFAAACYPAIFLTCLFQFDFVARAVRETLRASLLNLHFLNDKIAFFNLPALEIDTEVDGLMVIRGITFIVSSLTVIAHGVEVGIKISDDVELAIQVEEVRIPLFRGVEIGDVYANVKGGEFEMNFGHLAGDTHDANGDALMMTDTPLLKAAASMSQESLVRLPDKLTGGEAPTPVEPREGLKSVTQLSADAQAQSKYLDLIRNIRETNNIYICRANVEKIASGLDRDDKSIDLDSANHRRAGICSQLHKTPTIAHAPRQSIRVTTLQTMGPPWIRRFLHRMPLLYRMLLNPIAYFHPVHIKSLTAAGSGKWLDYLLSEKVFKHYSDHNTSTRKLQERVSAWLADANFALELADIKGLAQVPLLMGFDILSSLKFGDVMAYRTLPKQVKLKQVARLGGADMTVTVPIFLLPHHEHILPPRPTAEDERESADRAARAHSKPHSIQRQHELEQLLKDETNVNISVHARLPACLDQELLDFVAALVKATKMIEMEKELDELDGEGGGDDADDATGGDHADGSHEKHRFHDALRHLNSRVKEKVKRGTVNVVANDRWIAKMVGKITKKLETMQGDAGYSGDLPVALKVYRDKAESASKILP